MTEDALQIEDVSISHDEAAETLRAIRAGRVDALVVNAADGHAVVTLRDPDQVYRALVEAMDEGAALVMRDGIISYHNPWFAALVPGTSLTGRKLHDLVDSDARVSIDSMLERAAVGPARVEVELVTDDGSPLPVQLTASSTSVDEISMLCVVATDLREQRAQAELYRQALSGMAARDRLISIAGHELRSPLQALVFNICAVSARMRSSDGGANRASADSKKTNLEQLDAIHRQALHLATMVGNLLDVRLLGSDQLELTIEELDLAEVATAALSRSDDVATSTSAITVVATSVRGQWDRARLEQVATNLLSNAAKYGLGKPIRVVVDGDERLARLTVEDHGVGIAPDAVDRLFKPYERIGSVKTAPGLGLGLYITAQIVKAHGGTIRVERQPDGGSRFVVELPRSPAEP